MNLFYSQYSTLYGHHQPCRTPNYSPVQRYISVHQFGVRHSPMVHSNLELYPHTPFSHAPLPMQGPSTPERRAWRTWDTGVKILRSRVSRFLPRSSYSTVWPTRAPLCMHGVPLPTARPSQASPCRAWPLNFQAQRRKGFRSSDSVMETTLS
jgi:hypothetical protein